MQVSSAAFAEGQPIPEKYTCDGSNVSPPLEWNGVPDTAKSIAVICDDPDAPAGTFTHWILYDLKPSISRLSEGSAGGGKEGLNDFGKRGYGGPCPPAKDEAHRYFFRIRALDVQSLGAPGMSKRDVEAALKGHVVAEGQLMGKYKRRKK